MISVSSTGCQPGTRQDSPPPPDDRLDEEANRAGVDDGGGASPCCIAGSLRPHGRSEGGDEFDCGKRLETRKSSRRSGARRLLVRWRLIDQIVADQGEHQGM